MSHYLRPAYDMPKIYLYRNPVDFRKSFRGLAAIVEQELGHNPFDGGLYAFTNRQRNKIKCLFWEDNGFVLYYKSLAEEKFRWPHQPPVSPISFPLSIANNLLIAQISIRTFCVAQLTQTVIETSTQGMDAAQHRTCEVAHGVGGKLAPGAGCKNHSRRCQLWLQNSRIEGLCKVLSHSVAC